MSVPKKLIGLIGTVIHLLDMFSDTIKYFHLEVAPTCELFL